MSKITVAIPTIAGRESILLNCLVTLVGQTVTDWNLVVCTTNANTKPEKRDTLNPLNNFLHTIQHLGHEVTMIYDNDKIGPGNAVQKIIDQSESEWIWRVDDDVVLTPTVLAKLRATAVADYQEQKPVGAVAAPVNGFGAPLVNYKRYWTSQAPHLIGNGNYASGNDNFAHHSCLISEDGQAVAETDFLSGYCVLFNRAAFVEVGGYADKDSPKHHKEDWHATLKLRCAGYHLLMRGDAVAFHNHYEQDESDRFRSSRSKEDHALYDTYRKTVDLPEDRTIGLLRYEP